MNKKLIVDISFYDDNNETPEGVDFVKMKTRADGVIIRAGQNKWIDPDFRTNWKAAKEAGILRGSYWFYDSRVEPETQARLWAEAMDGDFGELPMCLDFEESYGGAYAGYKKWEGFVKNVRKHVPEKADHLMIYTGFYYWNEHTWNMPDAFKDFFDDLPLWVARYKATEPLVPALWDNAMLWQFTDTGDVELGSGLDFGLERKGADLNWFMGDDADWKWFTQGATIIEPPDPPIIDPPETDPPIEPSAITGKVVNGLNLSVRRGASTSDERIAVLAGGSKIEIEAVVVGDTYNWAKWSVYSAIKKNDGSKTYINLDEVEEPPIEPPDEPDPEERRADWKPDPNRPDELHVSRHTGYYQVPVYADKNRTPIKVINEKGELVDLRAPQSAIFVGDSLLGDRWLRLVEMNLKPQSGWIDITEKDMICDQVSEVTLNSLIPPENGKVEIKRTATIPPTGDFVYLEHRKTKDYKFAVPATQMLWADNNQRPAWMRTRPDYQWLYFDLMKLRNPGLSIIRYVSMYAYYHADNRYRSDSRKDGEFFDDLRDDVLSKNPDKPCWLMKVAIRTQGNVMKVLAKNGSEVLLDGLDMDNLSIPAPMAEDIIDKEWLVGYATQQEPEILPDGKPKTTHFPVARNSDGDETGTIELQIKTPYWINMGKVGLVWAENNRVCKVVNLKRDY
jgi:GH25 family lysozyme M1 (1,4-beta-N-acetylmuramidase)